MRTTHHGDGVTTYIYGEDEHSATIVDVRNAIERVEVMCRDILTAINLLIELLPEAHGNERSAESGDPHL